MDLHRARVPFTIFDPTRASPTPHQQALSALESSGPFPALQRSAIDSYTRAAQIASIEVRMNLFLPVFIQLGKIKASSDWSASAGIFLGNKATQGIAMRKPDTCTMSGCKTLPANCTPSVW